MRLISCSYQQLINESKQLTGAAPDLPAASSYRKQHLQPPQRNSLDNYYDTEAPLKPLYNSSPLASAHQSRVNDKSPHVGSNSRHD